MKKIIRLTESDLTRIIKRVIKENEIEENWFSKRFKKNKSTPIKTIRKDISDFTYEELERIWENVVRYVSPGFFEKDEAENYLLYDVTDGDRDLYNSIVDWFEESNKDEDIIRLLKTGIW